MNIKHNRGLALISLIIVVACIIIIGGILAVWLAHLAKRLLGPPPDHGGTNNVAQITIITVPPLTFAPLPAPPDATVDRPMGSCYVVIERCTNPFAPVWLPVATNYGGDVSIPDANPEVPMEFYRAKFVYP